MKFYIVTPTYNSLAWLKRAIRSVADQIGEGVEVHHHVQDGASKDGTQEWLSEWQRKHLNSPGYLFTYESCPDKGMYDALNHAWDKMPEDADVTAHLNSDEQYLPEALRQVAEVYAGRVDTDIVLGSFIVLNPDGSYHCHRRPVRPHSWSSLTVCEIITCSCFHQAATFRKHGVRFDASYKAIGDLVFFSDIMKTAPRVCVRTELLTSAYAMTGKNLGWTSATETDFERYCAKLPKIATMTTGLVRRAINFTRRIVDWFCSPPKELAIYQEDEESRSIQVVEKPTCIWRPLR
ncbi:MAG: glycosyltransferase [Akkermansiaceae bacterium]|nr:glycosyltransferase [Akkermansiaceae bacterium]